VIAFDFDEAHAFEGTLKRKIVSRAGQENYDMRGEQFDLTSKKTTSLRKNLLDFIVHSVPDNGPTIEIHSEKICPEYADGGSEFGRLTDFAKCPPEWTGSICRLMTGEIECRIPVHEGIYGNRKRRKASKGLERWIRPLVVLAWAEPPAECLLRNHEYTSLVLQPSIARA
jgi:hypothetical protein